MNINWNQLVKYVSDSKPIAIAAFVTSFAFLFGNELNLNFIPKTSEHIRLYAWGVFIFSGVLLLVAIIPVFYGSFTNVITKITRWYGIKKLSKLEKVILLEFVKIGPETLYVYNLLEVINDITSADILNATNSLKKKGLIRTSYDNRACWLSDGAESLVIKIPNKQIN